jgi:hypothetical protein
MSMFTKQFRSQSGVAMVTVLFIGAVLTVVASAGAFVTIKEFRAGSDDRRAAQALAYAEAGIDRMQLEIRGGKWNYQQIMLSGCSARPKLTVSGPVGIGTYAATVEPVTCQDPVPLPQHDPEGDDPGQPIKITSRGTQPTATRVVREGSLLKPKGLPIGLFAHTGVQMNGSPGLTNVTLITPGTITGRDQIGFEGLDPWYDQGDFYGDDAPSPDADMPAAAHAGNKLFCQSKCPQSSSSQEHPYQPNGGGESTPWNCKANPRGDLGLSAWDGSVDGATIPSGTPPCTGQDMMPPTSLFTVSDAIDLAPQPELTEEDFRALKTMAQNNGIYCKVTGSGPSQIEECTKWTPTGIVALDSAEVNGIQLGDGEVANLPNQFVVYVDFPAGAPKEFPHSFAHWNASLGECIDDPDTNVTGVVIVRNGSFRFTSGADLNGAIFAHDGKIDSQGTYSFNGTAIADEIEIISGADDTLDECWIKNMPMPFLDITPVSWSEVDR